MNAVKGRLKVSLLVVIVLTVGFGMYALFQVDNAAADHSSLSCLIKLDRIYHRVSTVVSSTFTGNTRTKLTNCPECQGMSRNYHAEKQYNVEIDQEEWYKHRWPWSSSWSECHIHTFTTFDKPWFTVPCGG